MSLIPLDRAPLLTEEDQRRRPAIDAGQLMRMLMIFLVCVLALILVSRHADTAAANEKLAFQSLPG